MTFRTTLTTLGVLAIAATFSPALADSGNGKSNGKANGHSTTHGKSAADSDTSAKKSAKDKSAKDKSAKHDDDADSSIPDKHGLASELKGLNAVKANPNALENASPNSQVGRIAAYRDAALATAEVATVLADAEAVRDALPVPARTVAAIDAEIAGIDAAIGALDPALPGNDVLIAGLQATRLVVLDERDLTIIQNDDIAAAQDLVDAAAVNLDAAQGLEDSALLTASKGRTLSAEAIAYVRAVLGL